MKKYVSFILLITTLISLFTITVFSASATEKESISTAEVVVAKDTYTYTGKAIKPNVKVILFDKTLKKDKDYTVKYSTNKNIGYGKITITGKNSFSGKLTATFTIKPKSVKTVASECKKYGVMVSWLKVSNVSGYQVKKPCISDDGEKYYKYFNVSVNHYADKNTKESFGVFYRVRTYKVVNGTKIFGDWSTCSIA